MDKVYVVDYDIPALPRIRMRFYRELQKLMNGEYLANYSTRSVLITKDEMLAKIIYITAKKYGKARIYAGYPVDVDENLQLVTPVTARVMQK